MPDYILSRERFIYPTPAGAYYAVVSAEEEVSRGFLLELMQLSETPKLTEELLMKLSGLDEKESLELLYQLQSLGLVQGLGQPLLVSTEALEDILPVKLKELSGDNKSLLADNQGFYIATYGFHHETAEELAGLAVELSNLQSRYTGLLKGNLNFQSAAFGLVNTGGQSDIGFWPVFIGEQRFTLVLAGIPYLNKNVIVELIWVLVNRYRSM